MTAYAGGGGNCGADGSNVTWKLEKELTKNTDYTVSYTNAKGYKEAGTYSVTITGRKNYTGTRTVTYIIKDKANTDGTKNVATSKLKVSGVKPLPYLNGAEVKQTGYKVKNGKTVLTEVKQESSGLYPADF